MDENRAQAYLDLIQQLLDCPNGEEPQILQANSELLDGEFLQTCEQVATMLAEQGEENPARFLRNLASQLGEFLGMRENDHSDAGAPADRLNFLMQLLLIVNDSQGNPQQVYPFLQQNLDQLDLQLAEILTAWATDTFPKVSATQANGIAADIGNLANLICQFPLGSRRVNLEIAIACNGIALAVFNRSSFPEQWAAMQNNLANAYKDRIRGEGADNLEQAIACYHRALEVFTCEAFPEKWATMQNNLANAYKDRIRGERADNLELAITICQRALEVSTRDTFPQGWAMTQNNLGEAYRNRIKGERADNLEAAIACFHSALEVYTRDAFSQDWAMTQNNLAAAYYSRIRGERTDNLEAAIACFHSALEVYTRDAFSQDWAMTQNNLGIAYSDRIRGERTDNLEVAIACYHRALEVRTRDAFPQDWATTQDSMGIAYSDRIRGERADNLEQAIASYHRALEVYTRHAFPEQWAMTQNNLANAYSNRIRGEKAENIESAIACYQSALEVRKREAFPQDWAMTQHNLANAYRNRIRGERADNLEQAIAFYQSALEVRKREAFPQDWAMTQNNLAIAYHKRIKGERTDNLEQAIASYHRALEVYTRDAFPEQWAMMQNNLAVAYSDRIRGERADNLEDAIECYEAALTVRTRSAFPQDHTETLSNLGNLYRSNQQWRLAYDTYTPAIETVEFLRGEIHSGDETKQKLAEQWNQLYLGMVEVCIALKRYSEAVEFAERSKGQNLIELLSVKDLYPQGEIPPEVRQELQQLRQRIAEENRRLQQAPEKNYDTINQLRQDFAAKSPYIPLNFAQIQQLADEKTAIVEWYILVDSFCAFIITEDQIYFWQSLPRDLPRLQKWAVGYLTKYYENRNKWRDQLAQGLRILAKILHIDEIVQAIPKTCDKLILIPHRYLHLFPLHALPISQESWQRFHPDNPNPPHNPYLLDCFDNGLRYTPSCQLLHKVQQQPARHFDNLFAIQTPTTDLYDNDYGVVNAIKQQFSHPVVIKKQQANKSALLKQNQSGQTDTNPQLQTTNCLFFYCHGFFDSDSPLNSGLVLADGNLTLEDIIAHFNLKNCRLVTMSACETGFTDFNNNSDEYIGLPSGFMLAGSHNIIGSLWTVSALATSLLMTKFYEQLPQSNNIALALNQSQQWLRDVTVKELKAWLPQSQLEDVWQEELTATFQKWENSLGADFQPLNSPAYWAGFCAIGKGV